MWLAHVVDATPRWSWGGGDVFVFFSCDLLSLLMLRHAGVAVGGDVNVPCKPCQGICGYELDAKRLREKQLAIRACAWEDLVRQLTHGKDLKEIPHTLDSRHECDKRNEIQDEKTRRSTVRVQKSVQIFKKMIEKFIHVSMNKGNYISQWTRRQMNWCHKKWYAENTVF